MFGILNLALFLAGTAVAAWIVLCGIPMVARAGFVERVSRLRDGVMDEALDGRLPLDDPAVQEFLVVADAMAKTPEEFGLSEGLAVHFAHEQAGVGPEARPSYSGLHAEQRKFMHNAERELRQALRPYLIFGSRFWWAFGALVLVRRLIYALGGAPKLKQHGSGRNFDVNADQLATDIRGEAKRRLRTTRFPRTPAFQG